MVIVILSKKKIPNISPTLKLKGRCEEGHGVEGADRGTHARTEHEATTPTRQADLVRNYYSYITTMLIVTLCHTRDVGGVMVTTSACHAAIAGRTGSIPGTGSCDIKIWLSTLGTVYTS